MTALTETKTMYELSKYEKKKWIDKYDRFTPPEIIPEGSEWGEFMEHLEILTRMGSYGASEELIAHAEREYLDQHYLSLWFIYQDQWGETPEELGLPPVVEINRRQERAVELGVDGGTAQKMAFDWAMKWREKFADVFELEQERKRLEERLIWNANQKQRLHGV